MLGAQDFCGYYDWTFSHLRRQFGQRAVIDLWAEAVGGDSQQHYTELGARLGMKGLFEAWRHTGEDEQCDWTFTLDESRNVLRWDMRRCPSKGFLIEHNLHADEDYCDHCIGWEGPMLAKLGMEMVGHEHNHCGQCWGEIRVKGKPYESLTLDVDIRKDPRWSAGHLDRFEHGVAAAASSIDVIREWANRFEPVRVFDRDCAQDGDGILISAGDYCALDWRGAAAVLFDSPPAPAMLDQMAKHFAGAATPPLLLYAYFPRALDVRFIDHGLPRPTPILPLLIRHGLYAHVPTAPMPSTSELLRLLELALRRSEPR